ncbi:MAG: tripartite tricarboxylate transporter permease [Nanoarchaeota archaeon]
MTIFFEMLIAIIIGTLCGIVTGLAPGIHVNLVVTLVIGSSSILLKYTTPEILCIFIIALSITHIFLEFIPSTFLGAPDASTILSVLPGHRYLLAGNGMMAVKLSCIGCFFGIIISSILVYPVMKLIPAIYPFIKNYMAFFLLCIIGLMILQNTKKVWATTVFLLAGILGLLVLQYSSVKDPLFPLLTGLFGTATLILSMKERNSIPEQYKTEDIALDKKTAVKALCSGQCSAIVMALFPGLSPAIAALFGMQLTKNIGDHGYMILQGCINSAGFIVSIITLYTIEKARNGAVAGIQQLAMNLGQIEILLFIITALVTAAIAVPITFWIGRIFAKYVPRIPYRKLSITICGIIVVLTLILSSWQGLLVLITATAIGIIPGIVKVTRTMAMGCLLVPTVVYYLW